jgi:ABC-type tungstate transport system substrate-binding protein
MSALSLTAFAGTNDRWRLLWNLRELLWPVLLAVPKGYGFLKFQSNSIVIVAVVSVLLTSAIAFKTSNSWLTIAKIVSTTAHIVEATNYTTICACFASNFSGASRMRH